MVYTIQDPYGTDFDFTFGVDAEVTNPAVGVYVLDLPAPAYPGTYQYNIVGTGAVEAVGQGEFTVLQSSVAPQAVPWPEFGPCTPWIDCGDIRTACSTTENDELLDGIATMASQIMFEISGRQFTGQCEKIVRPCETEHQPCWNSGWNNWSGWPWSWSYDGVGWGWHDQLGCHCQCQALSQVKLPGYPVTSIIEVLIDGVAQSTDTYRIDDWQYLTRMRDPLDPGTPLFWPQCQILDLPDTEAGTWSVAYRSGIDPPLSGKAAATALACELLPGADCKLPSGAVRIVRQGITIDKLQPLSQMLLQGMTGIVQIDAFLASTNSSRLRRRPSIWASGSSGKYARSVGL